MMKSDSRAPTRLLQPISVPSRKWEVVTTDLVTDLPPSKWYTIVVVFVDKLTKTVHSFLCTKEVHAQERAHLFFNSVF